MEMDTKKYSEYADKFKVDRNLVKEIFVDETLVKIDGQKLLVMDSLWWWWTKHIHSFVLVISYISQEKERFFLSVISFSSKLERNLEEKNQSTLMMALTGIMIWYAYVNGG